MTQNHIPEVGDWYIGKTIMVRGRIVQLTEWNEDNKTFLLIGGRAASHCSIAGLNLNYTYHGKSKP